MQFVKACVTLVNYRVKKIATDFDKELQRIKTKFSHAAYPAKFINDTFFRFNKEKEELLIPKWLPKSVVITLTFAPRNEKFSKRFISKLQTFINDKVRFNIIWNTHKIQSLFNNKDKKQHLSCIIYRGICSWHADYFGEIIRNVNIRWNEHECVIGKNSERFKHLQEHLSHDFQWSALSIAPWKTLNQKILKAYFIRIMEPSISKQMNRDVLTFFRTL